MLDDASNLVNSEPRFSDLSICLILIIILAVDPSLHTAMDKYAMFAVTCSHKFLDMYIDIIKAQNEIWVSHYAAGYSYVRKLKVRRIGRTWCPLTLFADVAARPVCSFT